MSFLNPLLLAFSAAIAVPIIIHFLNRRRFRQVSWAAMRFLQASIDKNRRRMEWEDLLLLLLRCLVLLLLAFALARPALRSASGWLGSGRAVAVIVLDQSASMTAHDGARSRFEQARDAALAAVDAYPPGSALAVVLAGDRTLEPIPEPTVDLNLVRKTLREAEPSDLATDHAVGILRALEILAEQRSLRKEIVLITDQQALGWQRMPEIVSALAEVSRDTRLRMVTVGVPLEDNLGISELQRPPGFASPREPVRVQAEVVNHGQLPVRDLRATLHVNEGPAVDEAVMDVLNPGQSRRVTFFARLPAEGLHSLQARLPEDRLPADDSRSLTLRAADTVRILIVEGDPESHASFFLRHALQPVRPEEASEYLVQPQVAMPGQLGLMRLGSFDAVILADVPPLPAATVDALADYIRKGGVLLGFPGRRVNPGVFNREMVERTGIFGAAVGEVREGSENDPLSLQGAPYTHPIFTLWNDGGGSSLSQARFRQAWKLNLPATNSVPSAEAGVVLLRFEDETPAAVEKVLGRGRTFLFASTAAPLWNDLAVRPAFVPFLHRTLAWLAESREERLNVMAGEVVRLVMPGELAGREVVIHTPGNPGRRLTRTVQGGSAGAWIDFADTMQAGPYHCRLAGDDSVLLAAFSVQMRSAESELSEIQPSDREEIERIAQPIEWEDGRDLRALFDRDRLGVELWLPVALAMLLLGLTETWLAQQFSRSK